MKYPKFLKEKDTIGVTAPSSGAMEEIDTIKTNQAIAKLQKQGFKIIITNNCYTSEGIRSSDAHTRKKQLESLYKNKDIKAIICLSGGEFLMEILPILDYKIIKNNPKWLQGYSDPTGLLFLITTNLDIATIYANNFRAFAMTPYHQSLIDNLDILKGKPIIQNSYDKYESQRPKYVTGEEAYNLDKQVKWQSLNQDKINVQGRIIGGCLDVLLNLIGTKYDKTKEFINKYKKDGIIWYFDNYSLTNEDIIRAMWQFKEAGWLNKTKLIIFGRNNLSEDQSYITLVEALSQSIDKSIPIIIEADLGHISPRMTIINGAVAHITYQNNKGTIKFNLK